MSDVAIRVEGLGKRYRLRHESAAARYRTLREDLVGAPAALWRNLRQRSMQTDELWALRDVSFDVKRGEVVGVIGRNGAGKSTLLKILSRIVEPTTGAVDLHGRVGSLLEVGTGFHPELTGRENIFLSGALLGMRRHEVQRRFDEIAAFAEIERFLDTPCKHYSSGMYTRLGFAVAAHLEAEILLVDEVLAVGDAEFQRRCLGKMNDVALAGRTVLFVSHNLEALKRLCRSAVVLENGTVVNSGDASAGVEFYLSRIDHTSSTLASAERLLRAAREGLRISALKVDNPSGVDGLVSGAPLRVTIRYETDKSYRGWDAGFVVAFRSPGGVEILRLSTEPISGYHIGRLARAGEVSLILPRTPFVAGNVHVDVGITRPGRECVVYISDALVVQIRATDVYNAGSVLGSGKGLIISEHEWQHSKVDPIL